MADDYGLIETYLKYDKSNWYSGLKNKNNKMTENRVYEEIKSFNGDADLQKMSLDNNSGIWFYDNENIKLRRIIKQGL